MIKVEMEVRQAAAVRAALFEATKSFTYDPTCVPSRATSIREVIVELDQQIEENLKDETDQSE